MEAEPPRGFSEQPFRAACRELDEPAVGQPWQLLGESPGLRLYRLCDEQSGLYEYKIYCILDDCPPKLCVDVYMDLDYRKQWDKSVKGSGRKSRKLPFRAFLLFVLLLVFLVALTAMQ